MLNDVYRAAVVQRMNSQRIVNVLHYQVTADPTNASSEDNLSQAINAQVISNWRPAVVDGLVFQTMEVTKVDPAGTATRVFVFPAGTAGTRLVPAMPQNVSFSITRRTASIGKRGRGRFQGAGLADEDNINGNLSGAFTTLANSLAAALVMPISFGGLGVTYSPCIWSKSGGSTQALRTRPITSTFLQPTVRVQRSRTVGFGV